MHEVVDEPVIVTCPLPHSWPVLQVIHVGVGRLPFLEWPVVPNQTKLDRRDYELETIQFDAITELLPKFKADGGTVRCT
jgi:hypothetical protein